MDSDLFINYLADANELKFDLKLLNNDLSLDKGLQSLVLVSLFTNARVTREELSEGLDSQQGWWGDVIENDLQRNIGSKLWLLTREKATEEVLELARQYCLDALAWFIEDGIAESVSCETSYDANKNMIIEIKLNRPQKADQEFKFKYLWEGQLGGL